VFTDADVMISHRAPVLEHQNQRERQTHGEHSRCHSLKPGDPGREQWLREEQDPYEYSRRKNLSDDACHGEARLTGLCRRTLLGFWHQAIIRGASSLVLSHQIVLAAGWHHGTAPCSVTYEEGLSIRSD
jgi:hypothetical protein